MRPEKMFRQYPDVVDVSQMCAMLGNISTKTGYKLLRDQKIEHIKVGRVYRIPKSNVIHYISR